MSLSESFSQWVGWNRVVESDELPEIFPMPVSQSEFIDIDIEAIYSKILIDTLERTSGVPEEYSHMMWDNCLKSEKSEGLVTMISKAMAKKQDAFIVFDRSGSIIRYATNEEQQQIRLDYKERAYSDVGIYISFANFKKSNMVKLYIALEYYVVSSLYKSMNLSKAIQLKMNELRSSTGAIDSSKIIDQAKSIAKALGNGHDVLIDSKDIIETSMPKLEAAQAAMTFTTHKLSFYLGMPASYIMGEQTAGIGSTGEADTRAVERGLKNYFYSIVKPILEALFGIKVSYNSQDFRLLAGTMEVLKTFSLIDETLVAIEDKRKIINKLLDIKDSAPPGERDPNA